MPLKSEVPSPSFNNRFLLAGTITLVNEATAELARNQVSNARLVSEGGNQYSLAAPSAQVVQAVKHKYFQLWNASRTPADEHQASVKLRALWCAFRVWPP